MRAFENLETHTVVCSNVKVAATYLVSPMSVMNDGLTEIVTVHEKYTKMDIVRNQRKHMMKGVVSGYDTTQTTIRGTNMRVVNKKQGKVAISVDGENILYFENFAKFEN